MKKMKSGVWISKLTLILLSYIPTDVFIIQHDDFMLTYTMKRLNKTVIMIFILFYLVILISNINNSFT